MKEEMKPRTANQEDRMVAVEFKTSMNGCIILPEVSRLWYSCRIRNHENHDV
jgi:hypothetical protein